MSFLGSKRKIIKPKTHKIHDSSQITGRKTTNLDRKSYSYSIFDIKETKNFSYDASDHNEKHTLNENTTNSFSKCNEKLNFMMDQIDNIEEKLMKREKILKKLRELNNGKANGAMDLFFNNKIFNIQNEISLMMNDYNFIVENYNHQLESISFVHECRSLSNDLIVMNERLTLEALSILRHLKSFTNQIPQNIQRILSSYEKRLTL